MNNVFDGIKLKLLNTKISLVNFKTSDRWWDFIYISYHQGRISIQMQKLPSLNQ